MRLVIAFFAAKLNHCGTASRYKLPKIYGQGRIEKKNENLLNHL
jgi:hypothetical protein